MNAQNLVKTKRKFKSTQLFVVAGTILVSLLISLLCVGLMVRYEVDTETADIKSIPYWKLNLPLEQDEWFSKGIEELRSVIVKKEQRGEVENVVIFIADGVNSEILSKARFVQKDETVEVNDFVWDTFPHLGLLKSDCSYEEKCDAFTLATALFGGVKTSKGLGGLDSRSSVQNCYQLQNETYHVNSIFKEAKALNMRTGIVTTGRVTGPLVAGLYAHSSDTHWECDANIPESLKAECFDVAFQLLKSKEGSNINVIMGGGRQTLVSLDPSSNRKPFDESACVSMDKRNLLLDWQFSKIKENANFKLIQTSESLENLKGSTHDYVLGIFANGDLTDRDPRLTDMITKSLDVLKPNDKGFILVAETAVKGDKELKLWELDDTIKAALKHPAFSANNTVLLTVFLDHAANIPNDILLYATGPKSYLFHGVHEETYMAHVIAFYLKMGIFKSSKNSKNFEHI